MKYILLLFLLATCGKETTTAPIEYSSKTPQERCKELIEACNIGEVTPLQCQLGREIEQCWGPRNGVKFGDY